MADFILTTTRTERFQKLFWLRKARQENRKIYIKPVSALLKNSTSVVSDIIPKGSSKI